MFNLVSRVIWIQWHLTRLKHLGCSWLFLDVFALLKAMQNNNKRMVVLIVCRFVWWPMIMTWLWHTRKNVLDMSTRLNSLLEQFKMCFYISSWAKCRGKRSCEEFPLMDKPSVGQYQKYNFQSHKWITPRWNARNLPQITTFEDVSYVS